MPVATHTGRNNIKSMFGFITWMVIFLCLCLAIMTLFSANRWDLSGTHRIVNSSFCFFAFGIFMIITVHEQLSCFFTSFGLATSPCTVFAKRPSLIFFCICRIAFPAFTCVTVFMSQLLTKFGQQFRFLAPGTSFEYNLLRHDCLLGRQLCSEPMAGPILAVGSSIIQPTKFMSSIT